jgi:8-oxo-dGTP diphosphatase
MFMDVGEIAGVIAVLIAEHRFRNLGRGDIGIEGCVVPGRTYGGRLRKCVNISKFLLTAYWQSVITFEGVMVTPALIDGKSGLKLKLKKALRQRVRSGPVSAKAVVVSAGKILILRQSNGNWDLPGGKVNDNESVTEGLIREVWEETNLSIRPIGLLTSTTKPRPRDEDLLVLSYLCEVQSETAEPQVRLSHEHIEYKLVDLAEALSLPLREHYAQALQQARKHIRKLAPTAA